MANMFFERAKDVKQIRYVVAKVEGQPVVYKADGQGGFTKQDPPDDEGFKTNINLFKRLVKASYMVVVDANIIEPIDFSVTKFDMFDYVCDETIGDYMYITYQ